MARVVHVPKEPDKLLPVVRRWVGHKTPLLDDREEAVSTRVHGNVQESHED